ncbi:DNA-directed RNA polymerase III subunit RPC7 isoform 3-T4 [Phoenicopterus ruber ruber]
MAGSGRGRGRAAFTFNIEAIGFTKGAALPDVACKPPPPFPSTDNKPVPLKTGEDEDYMLALKQDLRGTMKKMPYFLAVEEDREVIERYSKKYQDSEKEHAAWTPDWRRLPREMKPKKKTKKAGAKPKKAKSSEPKSNVDVLKKIEWVVKGNHRLNLLHKTYIFRLQVRWLMLHQLQCNVLVVWRMCCGCSVGLPCKGDCLVTGVGKER